MLIKGAAAATWVGRTRSLTVTHKAAVATTVQRDKHLRCTFCIVWEAASPKSGSAKAVADVVWLLTEVLDDGISALVGLVRACGTRWPRYEDESRAADKKETSVAKRSHAARVQNGVKKMPSSCLA